MKKFLFTIFIIFTSLFLFSSSVFATDINYTLTDDYFSLYNNFDWDTAISLANNMVTSSTPHYWIFSANSHYYLLLNNVNYSFQVSSNRFYNSSGIYYEFLNGGTSLTGSLGNWSSNYLNVGSDYYTYAVDSFNNRRFLYSNISVVFDNYNNNTYIFTYNNNSLSILNDGTNYYPSLYDLHQYFFSTPTPTPTPTPVPDNTPILTSFVDVVIDKLQLICEFFTSSYVYLSIFVVIILYFIILLFRRFI